jgi:methionyl-tRNA formyltransferase
LLAGLEPDLMVVVAYGVILPKVILQVPRWGCWNIHASLLPRWRGAAPIQRAIEHGDPESGVCIMQMDEGLDTGPLMYCLSTPLSKQETGASLHDRLADMGATALMQCVSRLAGGELPAARPQAQEGVTYAHKLDKAEARIDWNQDAELIQRRIRAFNPWPVAWCMIGGERTRIWRASVLKKPHNREPGFVLATGKEGIDIAAGQYQLRLQKLQRPGKRAMSAADYLNAKQDLPLKLDGQP